jgi:hypothetical protein
MPYMLVLLIALLPGACAVGGNGESQAPSEDRPTVEITVASERGVGSVRAAIDAANGAGRPIRIVSRLARGTEVVITEALPYLRGRGTELQANGMVLKSGECTRPDGREGCDGLVVTGPGIRVVGLASTGFLFDGIGVRGPMATDVVVSECHCFGNRDDGVGVSAGARGVVVERCQLEGNGFRTKGKGILVFDYATAELRDNVVRRNRDGITVSRRAEVVAVRNRIVDNYDKGLGIAGAKLTGGQLEIRGNGYAFDGLEKPPNADGVRVTLDSVVSLDATTVEGNGDSGVVVIGTARLKLTSSRIVGNAGAGLRAGDTALIGMSDTTISDNRGGEVVLQDGASVTPLPPP